MNFEGSIDDIRKYKQHYLKKNNTKNNSSVR